MKNVASGPKGVLNPELSAPELPVSSFRRNTRLSTGHQCKRHLRTSHTHRVMNQSCVCVCEMESGCVFVSWQLNRVVWCRTSSLRCFTLWRENETEREGEWEVLPGLYGFTHAIKHAGLCYCPALLLFFCLFFCFLLFLSESESVIKLVNYLWNGWSHFGGAEVAAPASLPLSACRFRFKRPDCHHTDHVEPGLQSDSDSTEFWIFVCVFRRTISIDFTYWIPTLCFGNQMWKDSFDLSLICILVFL